MLRPVVATSLLLLVSRADAVRPCGITSTWTLPSGASIPPHATVALRRDAFISQRTKPPVLEATLDGKPIKTKITSQKSGRVELLLVEIDSTQTGELRLHWTQVTGEPDATYTIAKVPRYPTEAHATKVDKTHFHPQKRDSENHDTLRIAVDVPAIAFHISWRRDKVSAATELELGAVTVDGKQTLQLGPDGCSSNFESAILDAGFEMVVDARLPDGLRAPVSGLPKTIKLGDIK